MVASVEVEDCTQGDVTSLLSELRAGNGEALNELLPILYEQLRHLASHHLNDEREGHTLGPTALVHEAYVRLSHLQRLEPLNRAQFFAIAGKTMRRVLVDHARGRNRKKRGQGLVPVPFDAVAALLSDEQAQEILILDDALKRLVAVDPRSATVVEMRFFGGFSLAETASHLGVSSKTIQRDWLAARAWLRKEVRADLGIGLPNEALGNAPNGL